MIEHPMGSGGFRPSLSHYIQPGMTPQQREQVLIRWREESASDNPPTKMAFSKRMAVEFGLSAHSIRSML